MIPFAIRRLVVLSWAIFFLPLLANANVDWPTFLARHDLLWTTLPQHWSEAPFLGNGRMGTMLTQTGPQTLEWLVGRSDVEDRRESFMGHARLPIGNVLLKTTGQITACNLRLDLWQAELRGTVTTSKGSLDIRAWVQADAPVIVLEVTPAESEKGFTFEWEPSEAVSPRYTLQRAAAKAGKAIPHLDDYRKNAPSHREIVREVNAEIQPLEHGGYATAWRSAITGTTHRLFISTAYVWSDTERVSPLELAVNTVESAASTPLPTLLTRHRGWWAQFYPKSFLSLPDSYWEGFYWIQLYKLASATRADGAIADLCGPWLQPTPWPATWWNLNVQLTYWLPLTSNHLDLADSLRRVLRENREAMIQSVPAAFRDDSAGLIRATGQDLRGPIQDPAESLGQPGEGREIGNLTWICHNLWLDYRMSMDETLLREEIYPLLRRAVSYYLHFLTESDDHRLHLPSTYSPEYKAGPDCSFDLALLRWGCRTLLEGSARLKIADPLRPRWEDVLHRLVDYAQDDTGFMIAQGVPLTESHRHYSHLLMAYPLYLRNVEQPGDAEIIQRTLTHWHRFPGALQGYSFTGGASISAALGHGDQALDYLNGLKRFIQPNTFYREAGPVIETPLSAAQSIHDLLLQSWPGPQGSVIRVFPAVPEAWGDLVFDQWRAEGAFLVSAARTKGKTSWVHIKSLAGERCLVQPHLVGTIKVAGPRSVKLITLGDGRYELTLRRSEEATLYTGNTPPTREITPLPLTSVANVFGVHPTPFQK